MFHSKNYVHRDIKPENFLIGTGKNSNIIYIIDFGLSKRYRDPVSGLHIQYKENKTFTGTARYASLGTHQGIEQSRRDDLESLSYLFVYFLNGSLPWQGIPAENKKEKYEKIQKKKSMISPEKLCAGLPLEFGNFASYCKKLKFSERPDYTLLLRNFKELFFAKGYFYDQIFDWSSLISIENKSTTKIKADDIISKKPAFIIPQGMTDFEAIMKQFKNKKENKEISNIKENTQCSTLEAENNKENDKEINKEEQKN